MSSLSFSRFQNRYPETALPKKYPSIEEEAVDILLKLDEEDTVQPGSEPDAGSNIKVENATSQLGPIREQEAENSVPKHQPTTLPSDVAQGLLKQAALLKRRS